MDHQLALAPNPFSALWITKPMGNMNSYDNVGEYHIAQICRSKECLTNSIDNYIVTYLCNGLRLWPLIT